MCTSRTTIGWLLTLKMGYFPRVEGEKYRIKLMVEKNK